MLDLCTTIYTFHQHPKHHENRKQNRNPRIPPPGLSKNSELHPTLFGVSLSMCLVTVIGNLLKILVVSSDSHFHTHMYFLLYNLSLVDIVFVSTSVPNMIVDIQTHSSHILYWLHDTNISVSNFWNDWDGLWLVCGHLSPLNIMWSWTLNLWPAGISVFHC
jgi:hypothetical protein